MTEHALTWALLAPAQREALAALVDLFRHKELGDEEEFMTKWQVIGGKRDYSAVLDRNPGSESTHDVSLAEFLSRKLQGPVHVLYFDEDYAGVAVDVYQGGRQIGTRPENPLDLARELGVSLPGDSDAGAGAAAAVHGVVLVEGAKAAEVARALGMNTPPHGPVHIDDGPVGTLMYNEAIPGPLPVMRRLSIAFPDRNVYTLSTGPEEGRFRARFMRGGKEVGTFDVPVADESSDAYVLDSVKGETTPQGVARALGVPPRLLNLKDSQ